VANDPDDLKGTLNCVATSLEVGATRVAETFRLPAYDAHLQLGPRFQLGLFVEAASHQVVFIDQSDRALQIGPQPGSSVSQRLSWTRGSRISAASAFLTS
jgi:hypothetical protein